MKQNLHSKSNMYNRRIHRYVSVHIIECGLLFCNLYLLELYRIRHEYVCCGFFALFYMPGRICAV